MNRERQGLSVLAGRPPQDGLALPLLAAALKAANFEAELVTQQTVVFADGASGRAACVVWAKKTARAEERPGSATMARVNEVEFGVWREEKPEK